MSYLERIDNLISKIDIGLIDFTAPRKRGRMPTQVSSEFLTNKEQGDWAENTLLRAINNMSSNIVAVHYGKNDNINAGDDGFKDFYNDYQEELDTIGKRPDILLFDKKDFPYDTEDISGFSIEQLDLIVPKAKCGIEVRSSTFQIDKYEQCMDLIVSVATEKIFRAKDNILNNYKDLLISKDKALFNIIDSISIDNIHILSFNKPSWSSTAELRALTNEIGIIKENMKLISGRLHLSITPKVEDLKVVNTWVHRYNVPHFYVQVFFDKAYGISFEKILSLISNPSLENKSYFIESDVKNQGKTTIKIDATGECNILKNICLPDHYSKMKELSKGRLLYYVKFHESLADINKDSFKQLFGIELD